MIIQQFLYNSFAIIIISFIIYFIFFRYSSFSNKTSFTGSKDEQNIENSRKDIKDLANYIRGLENRKDIMSSKIKQEIGEENGVLNEDKKSKDIITSKGDVLIIEMIASLENAEKEQKDIEAMQGRELDALVETGVISNKLKDLHKIQFQEEKEFFLETNNLQSLCENLSKLNSIQEITNEVKTYLEQFSISISNLFSEIIYKEKNDRDIYLKIIFEIKEIINIVKKTFNEFQIIKKQINSDYKKNKKQINSYFKKIKKYILYKKIRLFLELKRGKKLESQIVLAIQKEIKIAQTNIEQMNQIYYNLSTSFSLFEKNYSKVINLISIFKKILSLYKNKIKNLIKIEIQLKKEMSNLDKILEDILKMKQIIATSFVYTILNRLANHVLTFYNCISKLFTKDINFLNLEDGLSNLNHDFLENIRNLLPIINNLNLTNESIREGEGAILELMKIIVNKPLTSNVINEVNSIIKEDKKEINTEEKINSDLILIENQFEKTNIRDSIDLKNLISDTSKKINLAEKMGQRYSSYIGSIAQTLATKKNQINNIAQKEANKFNQSIQNRNLEIKSKS